MDEPSNLTQGLRFLGCFGLKMVIINFSTIIDFSPFSSEILKTAIARMELKGILILKGLKRDIGQKIITQF